MCENVRVHVHVYVCSHKRRGKLDVKRFQERRQRCGTLGRPKEYGESVKMLSTEVTD